MKELFKKNIWKFITITLVVVLWVLAAPTYKMADPIAQLTDTPDSNAEQAGETSRSDIDHPTQCLEEVPIECDHSVNACGVDSRDCE